MDCAGRVTVGRKLWVTFRRFLPTISRCSSSRNECWVVDGDDHGEIPEPVVVVAFAIPGMNDQGVAALLPLHGVGDGFRHDAVGVLAQQANAAVLIGRDGFEPPGNTAGAGAVQAVFIKLRLWQQVDFKVVTPPR